MYGVIAESNRLKSASEIPNCTSNSFVSAEEQAASAALRVLIQSAKIDLSSGSGASLISSRSVIRSCRSVHSNENFLESATSSGLRFRNSSIVELIAGTDDENQRLTRAFSTSNSLVDSFTIVLFAGSSTRSKAHRAPRSTPAERTAPMRMPAKVRVKLEDEVVSSTLLYSGRCGLGVISMIEMVPRVL